MKIDAQWGCSTLFAIKTKIGTGRRAGGGAGGTPVTTAFSEGHRGQTIARVEPERKTDDYKKVWVLGAVKAQSAAQRENHGGNTSYQDIDGQ